jgi:hypothetical protein
LCKGAIDDYRHKNKISVVPLPESMQIFLEKQGVACLFLADVNDVSSDVS